MGERERILDVEIGELQNFSAPAGCSFEKQVTGPHATDIINGWQKVSILQQHHFLMIKKSIASLLLLVSVCSCRNSAIDPELKENYESFQKADYNFPSGDLYYAFENFTITDIIDSLISVHDKILSKYLDEEEQVKLNNDVSSWLRSSVFVGIPGTGKGLWKIDAVNMATMNPDSALNYYLDSPITPQDGVSGKYLQLQDAMFTWELNGKKIFYDIVPANGKFIGEIGVYRVESSGDAVFASSKTSGPPHTTNFRYTCSRYKTDWYFLISSDDFFKDALAVRIVDTCKFYQQTL